MSGFSSDTLILTAMVLPALGALGILLAGRSPNLRETVTRATAGANWVVVMTLLSRVLGGERPSAGGWPIIGGLEIGFAVEPLGMLFASIAMPSSKPMRSSIFSIQSPMNSLRRSSLSDRKKRLDPGSPWRPERPRSWLSMRRDSWRSVPTMWRPPAATT